MHFVTKVECDSGYKLKLSFEDHSEKVVDLEPHLEGEMFEPLRNPALFRAAHLNQDIDTVVWDNGADMSPDFLYEIGVPVDSTHACTVAEGHMTYGEGTEER